MHDSRELQKLTKDWTLTTGRIKHGSVENCMYLKKEGAMVCGEGYRRWWQIDLCAQLNMHCEHIVLPSYVSVSSSVTRRLVRI